MPSARTLMEVYFPSRSALLCTLIIIGVVLVEAFNLFNNIIYRIPHRPRVLISTKSDVNDYYYNDIADEIESSPFLPADELIESPTKVSSLRTVHVRNDKLSKKTASKQDIHFEKGNVSLHTEVRDDDVSAQSMDPIEYNHSTGNSYCNASESIGFRQVDSPQYRSFRYMFHAVPIDEPENAVQTELVDDKIDEYDSDDDNEMLFSVQYAVCEFVVDQFAFHFPHTMQQLYRCWSWWRYHSDASPVLIFPHVNLPRNQFIEGFISSLQDTIQLQIISPDQLDQIDLTVVENGVYSMQMDNIDNGPLVTMVRPRLPPNLVDTKNLFGMDDPTCPYFALHSIDDARVLRDAILDNLLNYTSNEDSVHDREEDRSTTFETNRTIEYEDLNDFQGESNLIKRESRAPRIAILNRHKKRELQNADELAQKLRDRFSGESSLEHVPVVFFNDTTSFLDQVQFFSAKDIVISPHGAQLIGIPFMPNCGIIFEVFPAGYYLPYYFGSLASAAGLHHAFTSATSGQINWKEEAKHGMKDRKSRQSVRNQPICISSDAVVDAIQKLVTTTWYQCQQNEKRV